MSSCLWHPGCFQYDEQVIMKLMEVPYHGILGAFIAAFVIPSPESRELDLA